MVEGNDKRERAAKNRPERYHWFQRSLKWDIQMYGLVLVILVGGLIMGVMWLFNLWRG